MGKMVRDRRSRRTAEAIPVTRFNYVHELRAASEFENRAEADSRYLSILTAIIETVQEFAEYISVDIPVRELNAVTCMIKEKRTGLIRKVSVPSIPLYKTEDLARYAKATIRHTAAFIMLGRTSE